MIGQFVSRAVMMALGYAYPAYKCYKTVEMNKPEVEHLRFWCQYWILISMLTAFERIVDPVLSWLPMYCEAKVALIVYLWYTNTKGTKFIYYGFFRPYLLKHEKDIDSSLLELRTRSGDIAVQCMRAAWSYGQTGILEIMQFMASQAPSLRIQPVQEQKPQQIDEAPSAPSAPQPPSTSPTRSSPMQEASPKHLAPEEIVHNKAEVVQVGDEASCLANCEPNASSQDAVAKEAIPQARHRLRSAGAAPTATGSSLH